MIVSIPPRRDPWWQKALDALLPSSCLGCGRRGVDVCAQCWATLRPLGSDSCPRCSAPSPGGKICVECLRRPRAVRAILAAYPYEGVIRPAIHAFKYRSQTRLDHFLATALAMPLATRPVTVDVVMPVPLSGRRLRERGFNQAERLARPLATACRWPLFTRTLVRTRDTQPQFELSPRERQRNVEGAFAIAATDVPTGTLEGMRVLLVDDVCTTGATLDACARPLLQAGADGVWALVVARAVGRP